MLRPIAFDVTHLVSRLARDGIRGIDRVDLAYARALSDAGKITCGVHYGLRRPHLWSPKSVGALAVTSSNDAGEDAFTTELTWDGLRAWLVGNVSPLHRDVTRPAQNWRDWRARWTYRFHHNRDASVPRDAIYLNVAQAGLEYPRFFRWLDERPDVKPVFFIHDLLPLERPDFFPQGYEALFRRRMATVAAHARAILAPSDVVAARVHNHFAETPRGAPAVHARHTPSPLGVLHTHERDDDLRRIPYVVCVSAIERRKNQEMLIRLWDTWPDPPKLVLVGQPAFGGEAATAMLQSANNLRTIRRVSNLSPTALRRLIGNSRAVLMPSLAEGYGLPVVEALTLGTPALVSDIPVFHEIAETSATFVDPGNPSAWREAIAAVIAAPMPSPKFTAADPKRYFADLLQFLETL